MVYLWEEPKNTLNRDIGEYNRTCSPDRFLLFQGHRVDLQKFSPIPTIEFEIMKSRVLKFDCLPNNSGSPLVNERVKKLLEEMAPDDMQFFPAKLVCKDGKLEGYYLLNTTHLIKGIDHEKSIYTKLKSSNIISWFRYLTYKEGCMGEHHLARDEESHSHLLVSAKIKALFHSEKVSGVWLVRPEDYYGPIREV